MASKVEMWKSSSASLFDSEHDALRDDLRGLLIDSGGVNEASAAKAVGHIAGSVERLTEFQTMLNRLLATHPQSPTLGGRYREFGSVANAIETTWTGPHDSAGNPISVER